MQIELQYGKGTATLQLADDAAVTVVRKPAMPLLDDPHAAVTKAISQPVGFPGPDHVFRGANSACIAVCDITRPVPNHLFLRPLIESLLADGMQRNNITVLVATGLHRPNEGAELAELIGDPWVLDNVTVANHFARNDADHVNLGTTATRGTVVRLDRRFVEADLRIATGLVEPHFMAGYSGGRKVIAPGLAHAETITTFHSARFMADPAATSCNFVDNPLHEEQLEIVRMLGGALAVNTVIDEDRRLSFINFGEILQSHQMAVDYVDGYCRVFVPRRFHTVVTSAAGYPLDKTYYQTVKGMVCAMDILEPGGDLIIVSECSEGMGSAEFVAAQQRLADLGPDVFLSSILQKSHADIDEWQTQMQTKPMQVGRIHLVTDGLPAPDHSSTGVNVTSSLQAAVDASLSRSPDQSIAVIPEGPYVVPFFRAMEPVARPLPGT
ncbi:MAG: nickel-dependent lactate racemase [Fuerstiella sp.]|nr:nickel-dependent lactate racemase [Fuerstiella sp.]MCP4853738.1 nickel-dependent lactate racemase [Fuerstiella sp.]